MRGDEKESWKSDCKAYQTPMHFDTYINLEDVKNDFDYIIVATGDETVANRLGVWHTTTTVYTRVALVLGNFKVGCAKMWVNRIMTKRATHFCLPIVKKVRDCFYLSMIYHP